MSTGLGDLGVFGDLGLPPLPPPLAPALALGLALALGAAASWINLHLSPYVHFPRAKFQQAESGVMANAAVAGGGRGGTSFCLFAFALAAAALRSSRLDALAAAAAGTF